jgi:hypothetical protein
MVTIPPISVDDWGMVYGIPVLTFMGRSMGISMVIIFHNIGIMGRSMVIIVQFSQYYPNIIPISWLNIMGIRKFPPTGVRPFMSCAI